jgi:uncharacterized membrane protein HdeD (DUF308 family)
VSVELVVAGVVLILGGFLQIRVQRWSKDVPSVGSLPSDRLPSPGADGDDESPSPDDESDDRTDAEEATSRRLWVAWTEVLGVVSIVFGVVVLIVAFTR